MEKPNENITLINPDELDQLIHFYRSTGFLYEEKRNFLAPQFEEVLENLLRAIRSGNHIFKIFVLKEREKIVGSVCCARIYPKTWLVQHLTASQGSLKALRSKDLLVHATNFCQKNSSVNWGRMFWRPNNLWADRIFGEFARKNENRQTSFLTNYLYMTKKLEKGKNFERKDKDMVVHFAKVEDIEEIASSLKESPWKIIHDSEGFERGIDDLEELSLEYKEIGLSRERPILVARNGTGLAGFVLLECSSLGINFSELSNSFRLFVVGDSKNNSDRVRELLISRAEKFYADRGRRFAICLATEVDRAACEKEGFGCKKNYYSWTFKDSLTTSYLKYIDSIFKKFDHYKKDPYQAVSK